MTKEEIFAIVRHGIQIAAVGLSVNGYTVTGSDAQQIAGAVIVGLTIVWSILQKKGVVSA